jgi:hypothetical protein
MSTYTPTIVVNTVPPVSVTMVGTLTYQEFLNILGIEVFAINTLILESTRFDQLRQSYTYNIFDANGVESQEIIKPRPDPYQKQPTMYLSLKDKQFILNGQSSLSFNILPNESLLLEFDSEEKGIADLSPDYLSNIDEYKKYQDKL